MPAADVQQVASEFQSWAQERRGVPQYEVRIESLGAPHTPVQLPSGWQGIYCFRFGPAWLKVGKAGPKSGARWTSQHYNPGSAMSTLAYSLLKYAHLADREDPRLPHLRALLAAVGPDEIGAWMKRHTDRTNIIIRADLGSDALAQLEGIAHRILNPVFEGNWLHGTR